MVRGVLPIFAAIAVGCAAHPALRPDPVAPTKPAAPPAPIPAELSVTAEPAPETVDLHAAIARSLAPDAPEATPEIDLSAELAPIEALVRGGSSEPKASTDAGAASRVPPESIRRVVHQSAGRFRDCYQRALLKNPTTAGRVVVRFVIDADGSVARAEERSASLPDRGARQCVLEGFFGLSFPNPNKQRIAVEYPLAFSRDGSTPPEAMPNARQAAEAPPPGFAEAMRSGRRVQPPPPAVPPTPPPRMRGTSRCAAGDPMCSDLSN